MDDGERKRGGSKMSEWYSVTEAEKKTGIPGGTIRRYIRNHTHHLTTKRYHKNYLLHEKSLNTINKIRELYSEGMNIEQVNEVLLKSGIPATFTVNDGKEDLTLNVAETYVDIKKRMDELEQRYEQQNKINVELIERLEKQQKYIDERMNERDQRIMEQLHHSLEERRQLQAAAEEEKSKGSFLKRLFGRK